MKLFSLLKVIACIAITYVLAFNVVYAQDETIEAGIDEQLGDYLPLELTFKNSKGEDVQLKELINKPTLIAMVYYECPGICSPLQSELAWTLDRMDLPVEDFQVLSISFDHHETPEVAATWKRNYMKSIKRDFPEETWQFLTGDSLAIKELTDTLGFYFIPAEDQFVHAGAVIAISPKGKISRYLFGTTFNPFDMKMALLEAESGKTNPTISKVLQFCFSYDPEGRTYTLNITRIIGAIMLAGVAVIAIVTLRKKKEEKRS